MISIYSAVLIALVSIPYTDQERKPKAKVNDPIIASFKLEVLGKPEIAVQGSRMLTFKLSFKNYLGKAQTFRMNEGTFAILNQNGEQAPNKGFTLIMPVDMITIKDKVVVKEFSFLVPGNSPLAGINAGEDVFVVMTIRNLVGMVRLKATE